MNSQSHNQSFLDSTNHSSEQLKAVLTDKDSSVFLGLVFYELASMNRFAVAFDMV